MSVDAELSGAGVLRIMSYVGNAKHVHFLLVEHKKCLRLSSHHLGWLMEFEVITRVE
jgi:hypothetical protein